MLNTGHGPQPTFDKCYSHFRPTKEHVCLSLTTAAKTSEPTSLATLFIIACMFRLFKKKFTFLSKIVWPGVSSDADEVKQWRRLKCSMKSKH